MAKFSIWTAIEYDLAIICASIPTLKPFLQTILPGILSSKLVTNLSLRLATLRSSNFSSLKDKVNASVAMDGSIQMNPVKSNEKGSSRTAGSERGITTTMAFYSRDAGSDVEFIYGQGGIVKKADIEVTSIRGTWPNNLPHGGFTKS